VTGTAWIAALGEEVRYEEDLPACCRRTARENGYSFECPVCGAMWQEPIPVQPEQEDAFAEREERRGAA